MLQKETEEQLSKLGFDVPKLSEAIKSEGEKSLDVPTLYTEDQKNAFGSNRFNEGKTAMSEILTKEVKKARNIEFDSKDINTVIDHIVSSEVDKVGKPDDRIKEYKSQVEELQSKLKNKSSELEKLNSEFQSKLLSNSVNNTLLGLTPAKTKIPKEDLITLFNTRYSVQSNDGKIVVLKDNEIMKDDILDPVPLKDVYSSFISGYVEKNGMNGGDNEGGSSANFKDMDAYMKYCEKNNIEPMSAEGQKLLAEKKAEDFKY